MVDAVRAAVPAPHLLKVILETGSYPDITAVHAAARLAIDHGADFVKTSTGKTAASASPEAAEAMLLEIRATVRRVGLKPSGGIRSLDDALVYLDRAQRIMGPDWASPATFRFGASGLLDALEAELAGATPAASDAAY
jgi:deoxyribose-phosphate aldolase